MAGAGVDISLLIPARAAGDAIAATLEAAVAFFETQAPGHYEIIVIPNGSEDSAQTAAQAEATARRFPTVRVVPHAGEAGKGAALRTGYRASRGRWICFTDADLPYDLNFFTQALAILKKSQAALVIGNRRRADSEFDVPVSLLSLAYGRHRLGLAFNRCVRWILPLDVRDTQAGIKAFSRELAEAAFARQECPGFFFDLELLLTARAHGMRTVELPVLLYLRSEKSTVRLLRDLASALHWLRRIRARDRAGEYGGEYGKVSV